MPSWSSLIETQECQGGPESQEMGAATMMVKLAPPNPPVLRDPRIRCPRTAAASLELERRDFHWKRFLPFLEHFSLLSSHVGTEPGTWKKPYLRPPNRSALVLHKQFD